MDVKVRALAVPPMQTKWASCSTSGSLQFSTDLLGLDKEVRDYLIVHELLHFSVPNHGKLWKSLMRAHLGDYERLEGRLKKAATALAGMKARSPTKPRYARTRGLHDRVRRHCPLNSLH